MKKLGARNFELIRAGAETMGTFNPNEIMSLFEEHLYIHEAEDITNFLSWVHNNNTTFGSANYEEVFAEYKRCCV